MTILSVQELNDLRQVLLDEFARIPELKTLNPIARHLKAPQIPSILSESLAIHLLQKGFILPELKDGTFKRGSKTADVLCHLKNQIIKIEVKGTGDQAFQNLSLKDITAHYLIWIHFNDFFRGNLQAPILAYSVKDPNRFFKKARKIGLQDFKKIVDNDLIEHTISFDNLDARFQDSSQLRLLAH